VTKLSEFLPVGRLLPLGIFSKLIYIHKLAATFS
jgi:hypothetical protein